MTCQDLIDELKRFNPLDEVAVELTPESFVAMDEEPLCLTVDRLEPAYSGFDGCRAKITLLLPT